MNSQVKQAIISGFDTLKEFQKEIFYVHEVMGEFDPETGNVNTVTVTASISALVRGYKSFVVNSSNGAILATDRKVMFPSTELALKPSVNDFIKIDNEDFIIINVQSDLSESLWILQTRKS